MKKLERVFIWSGSSKSEKIDVKQVCTSPGGSLTAGTLDST